MKKQIFLLLTLIFCFVTMMIPVSAQSEIPLNWYCVRNKDHKQPRVDTELQFVDKYDAEAKMKIYRNVNDTLNSNKKLSFWDGQWGFVKYSQNQLVIVPKYNQISNPTLSNALKCRLILGLNRKRYSLQNRLYA